MKRGLLVGGVVLLLCLGLLVISGGKSDAIPYYVQLIQAGDDSKPPSPSSKPAGGKLAIVLQTPLHWKHLWQICGRRVVLGRGQRTRLLLWDGYEVEVQRTAQGQREVLVFHRGTVVSRVIAPSGDAMTVIGEKNEPTRALFVVVRRDPPGT